MNKNEAMLAEKRTLWLECLYADDRNGIGFQVYRLTDDFLNWWTINEARRFAPKDENGKVKGFGLLHGLLDRSFVASQMTAIRRLCDSSYAIDHKKRGVWSLSALLKDLEKNASLLTGMTSANQPVNNCLQADFSKVRTDMENTCQEISEQVNKFIAHAATTDSRSGIIANSTTVTPNDLLKAITTIKDAFDFISDVVPPPSMCSGNPVPKGCRTLGAPEQFDPLEGIDVPLVLPEAKVHISRIRKEMKTKLCKPTRPAELLKWLNR
jgi:hypothetical protein